MQEQPPIQPEADPRIDALEDAAFTAWQFAASFQQLPFGKEGEAVRPPSADDWNRAHALKEEFGISDDELIDKAKEFWHETMDAIYSEEAEDGGHFHAVREKAQKLSRQHLASIAIKGAVKRRIALGDRDKE